MVWSRESENIKDVREGSLYFNFCCHLFCHHYSVAFVSNTSVGSHCFWCFYRSLHFAISTSSYNNLNVKAKQVKCLEAFCNGWDLVAVWLTGCGKLTKAAECSVSLRKNIFFNGLHQLIYITYNNTKPHQPSLCNFFLERLRINPTRHGLQNTKLVRA